MSRNDSISEVFCLRWDGEVVWKAQLDGVIHDTHDPSRGGTRCVYGYYRKED